MATKSGFVSIIGLPNAGKSTLMNSLIGEKLSIVTSKPQTTRKRIVGILSSDDYQIIFLDTPGILNPEYLLQQRMLDYIFQSSKDADLILAIVDVKADPEAELLLSNQNFQTILSYKSTKKILVLNKVDLSNQASVNNLIEKLKAKNLFEKIIPVSALLGYNIELLKNEIVELLPEHPKYYPDDDLSDANERFFVSEIIREKIFELYHDEIPYSSEVFIEEFKERPEGKDYIRAVIVVERESQKPIIIGHRGEMIKKLGKIARESIEKFLAREVFLELFVKVKEKWRSDSTLLKRFGYTTTDDD